MLNSVVNTEEVNFPIGDEHVRMLGKNAVQERRSCFHGSSNDKIW
jgi:hypothetical protein